MPWMSWIHILKCVSYVAIYMEIHGYICYLVNARIMKFIPNEIRIMFSKFLALLWFLIIKTFNLKYLVGERYKGCISRPPLSVYSSVIKHFALAYMPCSLRRVFNSWNYILNFLMMDDMCFYIKNDHATVELLNYSHRIQSMVYTRLSLMLTSLRSYIIIT